LFTLKEFNELYHEQNLSLQQIAREYGTYTNKVRREAIKFGAKFRDKAMAQKNALATGVREHPTKGKKRSEKVKIKISESLSESWENMSQEEYDRRSKLAQDQWNKMTYEERQDLRQKANAGIRKASKEGSKLEKLILQWLIKEGYKTVFHREHIIGNEKMHVDIVIPELKAAIEIDGPSHFEPIWGDKKLKKSRNADNRKDGLLLGAGFFVVRILQQKELTQKLVRDILIQLEEALGKIKNSKTKKKIDRKIVIGV